MRGACVLGDLPESVGVLDKKDAGFWSGTVGRMVLRLMACMATTFAHRSLVSYLVLERNVPINSIPEDELA